MSRQIRHGLAWLQAEGLGRAAALGTCTLIFLATLATVLLGATP